MINGAGNMNDCIYTCTIRPCLGYIKVENIVSLTFNDGGPFSRVGDEISHLNDFQLSVCIWVCVLEDIYL